MPPGQQSRKHCANQGTQGIEQNIIAVEAAPEKGLEQLNGAGESQSRGRRPQPAGAGAVPGAEKAEGQEHQEVEEVFAVEAAMEVQAQPEAEIHRPVQPGAGQAEQQAVQFRNHRLEQGQAE